MKKPLFFVLFLFGSIAFLGCEKTELTGEYAIYQGVWESDFYMLELKENGRGEFLDQFGSTNRGVAGRVIISGNRLRIASTFANKSFHIDIPPTEEEDDDGVYKMMQLDGVTYIRQ